MAVGLNALGEGSVKMNEFFPSMISCQKPWCWGGTKACKHWLIPSILIWEREVGGTVVIEEVGDSRRKQKGSATREVSGRSSCHLLHSSLADVLVNAPVLMKSI